jgi:hypothetical protein
MNETRLLIHINEIFATTEVIENYENNSNSPIELIIEIPIRTEIIFDHFIARIKDKVIRSKIIESEKGEEKYNDAIAKGNTGITSTYNIEEKLYILKIGNILPKENLELKIYFIQFITIKNSLYVLNLMKYFPKIKDNNFKDIKGKIIIETNSKITKLISINEPQYSNENKKCIIEYNMNDEKILFTTEEMLKPILISQYNNKTNETNYILNYYNNNNDNNINSKRYPCLFIFLIDQSGSMEGSSIKNVSKALNNLLISLPNNSYYQLIGFGSNYKKYNVKPIINTNENINDSLIIINSLKAELGGTNISLPLKNILNESYLDYKNIFLSKHIILLTDGEINLGEDIIELINIHNNEFKLHSIGIGNNVNRKLIINSSLAGDGTYYFVDDSSNIENKVFEILNNCSKEYINKYYFTLIDKLYELQPVNYTTYNNESLNYCFIKEGNYKNDINIKFNWENFDNKFEKEFIFKSHDIIQLSEGEELSKLMIGLDLKYNNSYSQIKQIELSKKYEVLCKYTTLFAELENDNIIEKEMKTYIQKYSIPKYSRVQERFRSISSHSRVQQRFRPLNSCSYGHEIKKNSFNWNIIGLIFFILIMIIGYFINKSK